MVVWKWLENKKPINISLKQRLEGDVTVVCNKNMELHYLNKVAGFIFGLCDGNNTLDDIVIQLLKKFDVEESVLIADLMDIIRDLQFKRIIRLEV